MGLYKTLWVGAEYNIGESRVKLARKMKVSRQKSLAIDLIDGLEFKRETHLTRYVIYTLIATDSLETRRAMTR